MQHNKTIVGINCHLSVTLAKRKNVKKKKKKKKKRKLLSELIVISLLLSTLWLAQSDLSGLCLDHHMQWNHVAFVSDM